MSKFVIVDQNALDVGGHYYNYTSYIAKSAISEGFETFVLTNFKLETPHADRSIKYIKSFLFTWGEAESVGRRTWGAGNISYDFARAAQNLSLQSGDHVLFHTVGFAELISILDYLTSIADRRNFPFFHIIMRYDPSYMHDDIATFRPLFQKIGRSLTLRGKIFLYSDTENLSRAYSKLSNLPVRTLPIPFNQTIIIKNQAQSKIGDDIIIGYFGDARLEKGYNLLPAAIEEISKLNLSKNVKFIIQSNFNQAGGEKGIAESRHVLSQMKNVNVICESMCSDEYYKNILNVDAILIPYDNERYSARSSGILVEALAAGKPVLVSAGSWMSSQVSEENAVIWDSNLPLSSAIAKLIESADRLTAQAKAMSTEWLRISSGSHFIKSITSAAKIGKPDAPRRRVLLVMNGDAMVLRNGASHIALSQLEYLQKMEFDVCALFLGYDSLSIARTYDEWHTKLSNIIADFDIEAVFSAILDEETKSWWRENSGGPSIDNDLLMHRCFDFGSGFLDYLNNNHIDIVLLNYITSITILDHLDLSEAPIICEIHDIQSMQKALYGARPVSHRDLEAEFEMLSRVQSIISLNDHEANQIRAQLPQMPVAVTGVLPRPLANFSDSLAGCIDFRDVIINCRPSTFNVDHIKNIDNVDILFVGSNHLPNVTGLRWFLSEVFFPYLENLNINLIVAGSVTDYGDWPISQNVFYLGRLEELSPLYAAARIVILPILDGAGSPVKTAEAISQCVPAVATRHAMRGIDPDLWKGVFVVDDPRDFSGAVIKLINDANLRRACKAELEKQTKTIANTKIYENTMNKIFSEVLGEKLADGGRGVIEDSDPACSSDIAEWSRIISMINKMLIDSIFERDLSLDDAAEIAANLDHARFRKILTNFTDSIFKKQSALLLKNKIETLKHVVYQDGDYHFNLIFDFVYQKSSS